ncbi:MAG TPA: hypothetical protein PKK43_13550, partial [Spirochaetota bacterium]|nr:hypothetical protein [Spirochaetota bacterium]
MRKLIPVILATALIIPAYAFAVSPHPDVIKKWKENGTFDDNIAKYYERERTHAKEKAAVAHADNRTLKGSSSSILKASNPTGSCSFPVILIEFPGKTESSAWPLSPIATSLLFLALFGASAPLAFRFRRKGFAHAALVLVIVPGLVSLTPRCIGDDVKPGFSGTSRFDATSTTSFYQNLFEGSGLTMKKYYEDMSNNTFHPTFEIYGPYVADHSHDYYGENNDENATSLGYEAVEKLIAEKD